MSHFAILNDPTIGMILAILFWIVGLIDNAIGAIWNAPPTWGNIFLAVYFAMRLSRSMDVINAYRNQMNAFRKQLGV